MFKNVADFTADPLAVFLIACEVFRTDALKTQYNRVACFKVCDLSP
jgi:hypothetical protein